MMNIQPAEISKESVKLLPPPAPSGLVYRDFQIEAIVKFRDNPKTFLADEMGVGKTITSIGCINDNPSIRKILIICPSSIRLVWLRALKDWLVRRYTLGFATTKRWPLSDIVVTHYEAMKKNSRALHQTKWDLIIVDECHRVKNPQAGITREILGYEHKDPMKRREALQSPRWLMLSGSPIINRPKEVWSIAHHLAPETFDSKKKYIKNYCGGKENNQNKRDIGIAGLQALHRDLYNTIMIRRTKSEVVTELPEKIHQVIVFPADSVKGALTQEKVEFRKIQAVLTKARITAELAKAIPDEKFFTQAIRRLKSVEFTSIQQITQLQTRTATAKIPLVVEHANSLLESTDKIVIWGYHKAVIEQIAHEFGEAVVIAHGDHSLQERARIVQRFNEDPTCKVAVLSMKAMGEGHTLTVAHVCAFAELWWSPSVLDQAADRLHRIGQMMAVLIQYLVLDSSIDAFVAERIIEKRETIKEILDPTRSDENMLYAFSRAAPIVLDERDEVMRIAENITHTEILQIHQILETRLAGSKSRFTPLDLQVLKLLKTDSLMDPYQAALVYVILKRYR